MKTLQTRIDAIREEFQDTRPDVALLIKALFIPLKTKYYEAFLRGDKTEELRLYGARWNERTCKIGRNVILSKGYGKQNRVEGIITNFKRQNGTTFGSTYQNDIRAVYGDLDVDIACIRIKLFKEKENDQDA